MARYLILHPYFLTTVAGVGLGGALLCLVRRAARRPRPLVFKRRCRLAVPLWLSAAVVFLGAAFMTPSGLGLAAAPAAVAGTLVSAAVLTVVIVVVPRWWRAFPVSIVLVVLVVPSTLWVFDDAGSYIPGAAAETFEIITETGEEIDTDTDVRVPVAVLHLRRSIAPAGRLEIAVAPTGRLVIDPSVGDDERDATDGDPSEDVVGDGGSDAADPGVTGGLSVSPWRRTTTVPVEARLTVAVTITETRAELWWFPPTGMPREFRVQAESTSGSEVLARFVHPAATDARRMIIAFLQRLPLERIGAFTTREIRGSIPVNEEEYLQPGVYSVEIRGDLLSFGGESSDSR